MENPIKRLRTKAGMSQCELADYLGVARTTVSNWEIEHRFPGRKMLKKLLVLAKKYDMEMEILGWL